MMNKISIGNAVTVIKCAENGRDEEMKRISTIKQCSMNRVTRPFSFIFVLFEQLIRE